MSTYRTVSSGYWVSYLLPLALYLTYREYNFSLYFLIATFVYNATIINLTHYLKIDRKDINEIVNKSHLALSALVLLHNHLFRTFDKVTFYDGFTFASIFCSYIHVEERLIQLAPKSFTLGEAQLVTQGFLSVFWLASIIIPNSPEFAISSETTNMTYVALLGFLILVAAGRIVVFINRPNLLKFTEEFYCLWAKTLLGTYVYRSSANNILNLFSWAAKFIVFNETRMYLMGYWIACFLVALVIVGWKHASNTNTIDRKYFHFLIVAVFLPGIIYSFPLLYMGTIGLTLSFLFIELLRFLRVKILKFNLGEKVDGFVSSFRDRQDEGEMILTPIYLLAGASIPFWLGGPFFAKKKIIQAAMLSGITSVGIGDTFASIGGYKLGKHPWKGTRKTLEGTLCSLVAQISFILYLQYSGIFAFDTDAFWSLIFSSVVNAIVEAKTDQIDNLVLPLLTYNLILGWEPMRTFLFSPF